MALTPAQRLEERKRQQALKKFKPATGEETRTPVAPGLSLPSRVEDPAPITADPNAPSALFEKRATATGQDLGVLQQGESVLGTLDPLRQEEFAFGQEREKSSLERKIQEATTSALEQQKQQRRQLESATSSVRAATAQGREGVISGARAEIAPAFQTQAQEQLDITQRRIENLNAESNSVRASLAQAQKDGRRAEAVRLQSELDRIETAKVQAEADKIQQERETAQFGRDIESQDREAGFDMLSRLDAASIAGMTAGSLSGVFKGSVPDYALAGIQSQAAQLAEAQAKGDEIKIQQAQANLQKSIQELSAPTGAQADIQFLQELEASGAGQDIIDSFKARAGITGKLEAANAAAQPAADTFTTPSGGSTSFSITKGTGDDIPNALNNPGNLKAGGAADAFAKKDAEGNLILSGRGEGRFLTFDSPEYGFKAMLTDIGAKQSGRTRTALTPQSSLLQFAQVYANAGQEYVENIVRATGINPNSKIGEIDTGVLASGVAFAEGFNGVINLDPVSDSITATEKVFISSLVKDTLGTRAVKDPAIMKQYEQAFIENGKDRDALEDLVRISGQSDLFSGSIRDAAEQISFDLSKHAKDTMFDSIDRRLGENNVQGAREALKAGARASVTADESKAIKGNERLFELISEIKSDLQTFEELGGDTGIFTGTNEAVQNKIGRTSDPKAAQIATKIQKTIQSYRKAVSGSAFTESEAEEYKEIFPSIGKTAELNAAKIAALDDIIGGDIRFFYETALGKQAYGEIFGGEIEKAALSSQQPAPLTPMQQLDQDELDALDAELAEIEAQLNQ